MKPSTINGVPLTRLNGASFLFALRMPCLLPPRPPEPCPRPPDPRPHCPFAPLVSSASAISAGAPSSCCFLADDMSRSNASVEGVRGRTRDAERSRALSIRS